MLAFPPFGWWPLAVPAVAVLTLLCRGRSPAGGAALGLAFGLAFFLGLMPWLRVIGPDAWLLLSLVCALYVALLGGGLALATRLPGWPVWTAALWVAEELVRGRVPWGGFPWGDLAFSQAGTPLAPYAAVGGAALVTFAVALAAGLLAWAAAAVRSGHRWRAAGALAASVAVPAVGLLVPVPTAGAPVTAAVVQGNVPGRGMDAFGRQEQVLANHVQATERLAAEVAAGRRPQPRLVIWPENASDLDPFADPAAAALIQRAVDAVDAPVLVGVVVLAPDGTHLLNEGVVWSPGTGPGERYVKRHPVPFGEYVPFRSVLTRFVGRFDRVPRDFAAGDRAGVLDMAGVRVGDVICFEVAYDELVRDTVRGGAELLAVQTNNATYGRTGQVEQQLAMARLRAVEHGRSVLVAATSGISAVITPDGQVQAQAPEFTQRSLVEAVPLRTALTLADHVGAGPEWLLAIVGVCAALGGLLRTRAGGPATGRHDDEEPR